MKPNLTIDMTDIAALTRRLSARKITPSRFNIDLPVDQIANALTAAYGNEVRRHGREMTLDDDTKAHIDTCARWLADPKGKPWLMLGGLYGNGKTTMLTAICDVINLLFDSALSTERRQIKVMRAVDLARLGSRDDSRQRFQQYVMEDLLAIDDLGDEPSEIVSYGMTYTPLKDLLTERYRLSKFTIVSTNLINTPDNPQLEKHYGERVMDRFYEMMEGVAFQNPSYRKK